MRFASRTIQFADFGWDLKSGELSRNGARVLLPAQWAFMMRKASTFCAPIVLPNAFPRHLGKADGAPFLYPIGVDQPWRECSELSRAGVSLRKPEHFEVLRAP